MEVRVEYQFFGYKEIFQEETSHETDTSPDPSLVELRQINFSQYGSFDVGLLD